MNPSSAPQFTPPQSVAAPQAAASPVAPASKRQFIWGLVCLLGPTALIVLSILVYALVNFIAGSTDSSMIRTEVEPHPPVPLSVYLNVGLFIVGAISVLAWLPGIIVGIILLATRKNHHA